jgi:hypothetical protein
MIFKSFDQIKKLVLFKKRHCRPITNEDILNSEPETNILNLIKILSDKIDSFGEMFKTHMEIGPPSKGFLKLQEGFEGKATISDKLIKEEKKETGSLDE